MSSEERLAYLLSSQWVPTNTLVTIGMLRDDLGFTPSQYGLVRRTLDTAISSLKASSEESERLQGMDLSDALQAMLNGGISLSAESRQSTIDLLAGFGQWPNSIRDAIKSLGGSYRLRWQIEGYTTEPSLESVQAELQEHRNKVLQSAIQAALRHAVKDAESLLEDSASLPTIEILSAKIAETLAANWPEA